MCTRKSGRYTENDAARVVRQMLKAAAECHLHGLVHRDMKPEVCPNWIYDFFCRENSPFVIMALSVIGKRRYFYFYFL